MSILAYSDMTQPQAPSAPLANSLWRLIFTHSNDPQYISVADVNFRKVTGVDNPMVGNAFASSEYGAGFTAKEAFDSEKAGTGWVSLQNQGVDGWLGIKLQNPFNDFVEVAVTAYASGPGAAQAPKGFIVQRSVFGLTWEDMLTVTDQTDWEPAETRVFVFPV